MAVTWKKLAFDDSVVHNSLYGAYSVVAATTSSTPITITMGNDTLLGKVGAGAIAGLSIASVHTLLGDVSTANFSAQGTMVVGSGVNTFTTLAAGTAGLVLTSQGPGNALIWASALSASVFDAAGDLLVGVSNDNYAKLTKGSDYQVLRARTAATNGLEYAPIVEASAVADASMAAWAGGATGLYVGKLASSTDLSLWFCQSAS